MADKTDKPKLTHTATLISGQRYHFLAPTGDPKHPKELVFIRDKPVAITAAVKKALSESAWEEVTVRTGNETTSEVRDKFAFAVINDGDELPEVSTGIRKRPTNTK